MTHLVTLLTLGILMAGSTSAAAQPYRVEGEFVIQIEDGWQLSDSTGEYPFHLTDLDRTAEMYIFRSRISAAETIDNEQMLRLSVEAVIDGVLPEMSKPELKRSAGYFDGDNASFVIDFLSIDSTTGAAIYHRLKGILYRMHDDSQALLTLWAKSTPENFPIHEPAIEAMVESFEFIGPRRKEVFASNRDQNLWLILFALGGLGATGLYVVRLRQQRLKLKLSQSSNFWRCGCGRLNYNSRQTCRRCGCEHAKVLA